MKNLLSILLAVLVAITFILWIGGAAHAQTTWRPPAKPTPPGAYIITAPGGLPRIPVTIVPARPIQLLDEAIGTSLFTTGGVWLESLANLYDGGYGITSITGQGFTGIERDFIIADNGSRLVNLTTVSLPSVQWIGGSLQITESNPLVTLNLPALKHVGGELRIQNQLYFATLTLPELETTGEGISIIFSDEISAITLPKLKATSLLHCSNCPALLSVSLPMLQTAGELSLPDCAQLATISLPALVSIGTIYADNSTAIQNVTIGSTLKRFGGDFTLTGRALTAASVDNILTRMAALDGTNGTTLYGTGRTINLSGGTSAAPTFTGTTATSTAIVGNGTTATVTLAAHGYTTGDLITISGAVNSAFNGTKQITVTGTDTFTFACTYSGTASTQGALKKAGNTTEGFYRKQQLQLRGVTVTTN